MSDAPPKKRSLCTLWLLLGLTAAPVVVSYGLYFFWWPERTVNYGDLIEPRPLPDPPLALADGTPFRLSQLRGKWVLLSLDSGACDAHCERKLLYMQQLRRTQGKERDRIERAWLVTDEAAPRAGAAGGFPGTWVVRAGGTELPRLFAAERSATDHIYIVDPLGNLMMRFPRDPEPKRMIRDLARLLKASRIG
jgi:cytochrome oxidase Cu insertion factor (SCO1/SenC/PrrC family)